MRTCHCHIDEAWLNKKGEPDDIEKDMIDFILDPKLGSRLSCQIIMSEELDGVVVNVLENQY